MYWAWVVTRDLLMFFLLFRLRIQFFIVVVLFISNTMFHHHLCWPFIWTAFMCIVKKEFISSSQIEWENILNKVIFRCIKHQTINSKFDSIFHLNYCSNQTIPINKTNLRLRWNYAQSTYQRSTSTWIGRCSAIWNLLIRGIFNTHKSYLLTAHSYIALTVRYLVDSK